MRLARLWLFLFAIFALESRAQAPVYVITQKNSSIKFYVKSSVAIRGGFDKWTANLKLKSPDVSIGALDMTIRATSVNTGTDHVSFKEDYADRSGHF
jgi:polyisoprenoid-binding protein YceI